VKKSEIERRDDRVCVLGFSRSSVRRLGELARSAPASSPEPIGAEDTSFRRLTDSDVEGALTIVWKFLLFAAANPSSSIRLSAYQTTGSFLLQLTPYFPVQIQRTFSHVSMLTTIDLKSSAIIASAFAFISRGIAFPFLGDFLDSTPVFHHFAISDPIFSEHLSSIVANLGNLGLDWYHTLLHSFLAGAAAPATRRC
jgi:hypothetical protein